MLLTKTQGGAPEAPLQLVHVFAASREPDSRRWTGGRS